jgi:hypothetical protein
MRTGGLLYFLRLFVLVAGTPFGFGPHGPSEKRAVRPNALMSPEDGPKEPLNDACDPVVKQEDLFKRPVEDMNTVFEIGPAGGRSMVGRLGTGGWARIELDVGAIGEEPVEGDQNEVGEDLLFNAALGSAMKIFNDEDALAHLVKFLDAPSAMVDIDELLERISNIIKQGGAQAK